MVEFVQITSGQLDAGEQTFEAFRILSNGMVEWARWNSSGYLLDHAEPRDMGSETFDRVVSSPSFLKPYKPPQDYCVLGRPVFRLDMATLSESAINAVAMTKMPDDIAQLTDELRHRVTANPVPSGWYIWTQPYPLIGGADIDLTKMRCDSAVTMGLSKAVATGRLIVQADDSIQAFVSGEHVGRTAFTAKLEVGELLFGIIHPRSSK